MTTLNLRIYLILCIFFSLVFSMYRGECDFELWKVRALLPEMQHNAMLPELTFREELGLVDFYFLS